PLPTRSLFVARGATSGRGWRRWEPAPGRVGIATTSSTMAGEKARNALCPSGSASRLARYSRHSRAPPTASLWCGSSRRGFSYSAGLHPTAPFSRPGLLTLEEEVHDRTRLITRACVAAGYPYFV